MCSRPKPKACLVVGAYWLVKSAVTLSLCVAIFNWYEYFLAMYTTHKARVELGDAINREIEELAAKPRPVLITTDIFTEGVNLQMFDAVVNYEVVWSPTKHVQRIGRVWRLGQKSQDVAVVDMHHKPPTPLHRALQSLQGRLQKAPSELNSRRLHKALLGEQEERLKRHRVEGIRLSHLPMKRQVWQHWTAELDVAEQEAVGLMHL